MVTMDLLNEKDEDDERWDNVWEMFSLLEIRFGQNKELRDLFQFIGDLELKMQHGKVAYTKLKLQHMKKIAPLIQKIIRAHKSFNLQEVFGMWSNILVENKRKLREQRDALKLEKEKEERSKKALYAFTRGNDGRMISSIFNAWKHEYIEMKTKTEQAQHLLKVALGVNSSKSIRTYWNYWKDTFLISKRVNQDDQYEKSRQEMEDLASELRGQGLRAERMAMTASKKNEFLAQKLHRCHQILKIWEGKVHFQLSERLVAVQQNEQLWTQEQFNNAQREMDHLDTQLKSLTNEASESSTLIRTFEDHLSKIRRDGDPNQIAFIEANLAQACHSLTTIHEERAKIEIQRKELLERAEQAELQIIQTNSMDEELLEFEKFLDARLEAVIRERDELKDENKELLQWKEELESCLGSTNAHDVNKIKSEMAAIQTQYMLTQKELLQTKQELSENTSTKVNQDEMNVLREELLKEKQSNIQYQKWVDVMQQQHQMIEIARLEQEKLENACIVKDMSEMRAQLTHLVQEVAAPTSKVEPDDNRSEASRCSDNNCSCCGSETSARQERGRSYSRSSTPLTPHDDSYTSETEKKDERKKIIRSKSSQSPSIKSPTSEKRYNSNNKVDGTEVDPEFLRKSLHTITVPQTIVQLGYEESTGSRAIVHTTQQQNGSSPIIPQLTDIPNTSIYSHSEINPYVRHSISNQTPQRPVQPTVSPIPNPTLNHPSGTRRVELFNGGLGLPQQSFPVHPSTLRGRSCSPTPSTGSYSRSSQRSRFWNPASAAPNQYGHPGVPQPYIDQYGHPGVPQPYKAPTINSEGQHVPPLVAHVVHSPQIITRGTSAQVPTGTITEVTRYQTTDPTQSVVRVHSVEPSPHGTSMPSMQRIPSQQSIINGYNNTPLYSTGSYGIPAGGLRYGETGFNPLTPLQKFRNAYS